MRKDFPSADYVGNQHYVFNIKGNNYRLIVVVMFMPGLVYIRWVGTHKEYDKIDCRIYKNKEEHDYGHNKREI